MVVLRFSAFIATVRFIAGVLPHVLLHVHFLRESFTANVAHESPAEAVNVHVRCQSSSCVQPAGKSSKND